MTFSKGRSERTIRFARISFIFLVSNTVQIYQQLSGLCDPYQADRSDTNSLDQNAMYQALGYIENRAATTCLPPSPLRNSFTQPPNIYGYNYQNSPLDQTQQLLQRLQSLSGYTPPNMSPYSPSYPPTPSIIQYPYSPLYSPPNLNNTYTLQPPPQKKLTPSPLALRHPQFTGSPVSDRRPSPIRPEPEEKKQTTSSQASEKQESSESHFIKPLSQVGTLTTTDPEGRVRVIVPVPSGAEDAGDLLRALRLGDEFPRAQNVPSITRSTSEKVPNRSELMSQVQRTAWARHTTK